MKPFVIPVASAIAEIATRQHGVFQLSEAEAIGVPARTIRGWAEAGHLHRIHHSVYSLVPPALLSEHGRWLAAVKACGPSSALSYESGGKLVGLFRSWERVGLHVSVNDRIAHRPPGIFVHRPRNLPATDLTARKGIPTTTATRVLWDLTPHVSERRLRELFERAEYLDILDRVRLRRLLDHSVGHKNVGHLRRLADYEPLPLSKVRSGLEMIILRTCRTFGLPLPGVNMPLLDYEVDFHWPDARLVVETDGGHHRGPRRARDNERDLVLQRAGQLVRRYSEEAVQDEHAVSIEIRELLQERLG